MPKVYRVEHKETGSGPYHNYSSVKGLKDAPYYIRERAVYSHLTPTPPDDIWASPIDGMVRDWYFCFVSQEQLEKWFVKHARNWLNKHGYVIVVYEVSNDNYVPANRQAIFNKDEAKQVEILPLAA